MVELDPNSNTGWSDRTVHCAQEEELKVLVVPGCGMA